MKKFGWLVMFAALLAAPVMATSTVATFLDPSAGSGDPMFVVDLTANTITGGWADSQTGLDLLVPWSGNAVFNDAFFIMDPIVYNGGQAGGATGSGIIKFFENNQDTDTTPLVQIVFDSGQITPLGLGGTNLFFSNGVVITGSQINGSLINESFSFSFANQKLLNNGFSATAAFTSSASVPEPATMALFGLGAAALLRRRKRA